MGSVPRPVECQEKPNAAVSGALVDLERKVCPEPAAIRHCGLLFLIRNPERNARMLMHLVFGLRYLQNICQL
jgi:hypothetical protein